MFGKEMNRCLGLSFSQGDAAVVSVEGSWRVFLFFVESMSHSLVQFRESLEFFRLCRMDRSFLGCLALRQVSPVCCRC